MIQSGEFQVPKTLLFGQNLQPCGFELTKRMKDPINFNKEDESFDLARIGYSIEINYVSTLSKLDILDVM